jgi:hypothetical protein
MEAGVAAKQLLRSYRAYADLLEAVGHGVEPEAVATHLADDEEAQQALKQLLGGDAGGNGDGGRVPKEALERMKALCGGLVEELAAEGEGVPDGPAAKARAAVEKLDQDRREQLADVVLLNGHRKFLRARYMDVDEFRALLEERGDRESLALVKLVRYLWEELAKRGFDLDEEQVRSWFGEGECAVGVPRCVRSLMQDLNGEFEGGLIPLEELVGDRDPDEWLEEARTKLLLRSHSAMHKAIAEVTNLKYDCVHKALSGRQKAKRIQAEIRQCLLMWLDDSEAGREPSISDEHRGVPVEDMHDLLPALERKFDTKEEIYRLISRSTGVKTGSVRRYFQSNGQLKYAPLAVYRCAKELATTSRRPRTRTSYLANRRTRRVAAELAHRAREALKRWRAEGEGSEEEIAFKELRRALIVTIKEGRSTVPAIG